MHDTIFGNCPGCQELIPKNQHRNHLLKCQKYNPF